jgi:hypothetical protein
MSPHRFLLVLFSFALLAPALPAGAQQAPAGTGDVTITQDTTWSGETHTILHDLVVRAPATLRLLGTHVLVGDRILVERNATLEMHPLAEQATEVSSLPGSGLDETHGAWMQVNGTFLASGTPRTDIHGLRGSGLNNLFFTGGGIQVSGRADVVDLHLHDSNGTLVAAAGGSVTLRDAVVDHMGFMGLGALGDLRTSNLRLTDTSYGIMSHSPCTLDVQAATIVVPGNAILDNSCPLAVADSDLQGTVAGLFLSGSASVNATRLHIHNYSGNGVSMQAFPDDVHKGQILTPELTLRKSHVEALPGLNITQAVQGIDMSGGRLHLYDTVVEGNQNGIQTKEDAYLDLANATLQRNKIVGILCNGCRFDRDLLLGNHFGSAADGTANILPVVARMVLRGIVYDEFNRALPGTTVKVFAASDSSKPIGSGGAPFNATVAQALYSAYALDPGSKQMVYAGPFTYELDSPHLAQPKRGTLGASQVYVTAQSSGAAAGGGSGMALPSLLLFGAGALMVLVGLFWRPLTRMVGKLRAPRP